MRSHRVPHPRPEAYTAPVSSLIPGQPARSAEFPLWLVVPMGLIGLFFFLFGGVVWSVVFFRLGLDTSPQQDGSTPVIYALWFGTMVLLGIGYNRIERWWRARFMTA